MFTDVTKKKRISFNLPVFITNNNFREFTLTWYNNEIQLHYVDTEQLVPVVEYRDDQITSNNIGCIKLYTPTTAHVTQWLIESKLFSHTQNTKYSNHYQKCAKVLPMY